MAVNKILANINLQVGDIISGSIELQSRGGTAANLTLEIVFLDGSDVVLVTDGVFKGTVVEEFDSVDSTGPWYRSVINNLVIPTGAVKINVGFSYDSLSISTASVAAQRPVINRGKKVAPFIRPSNDGSSGASGISLISPGLGISTTVVSLSETEVALTNPVFVGAEPASPEDGWIWFDTANTPAIDADTLDGFDSTDFARINNTTPTAGYLYIHRDSANPAIFVRQASTGHIARFFQSPSAAATSSTSQLTIENDGGIVSSGTGAFQDQVSVTTGANVSSLQDDRVNLRGSEFIYTSGGHVSRGDSSTLSQIILQLDDGTTVGRLYASSTNDIGLLRENGSWTLRKTTGGILETRGSSTGNANISYLEIAQSDGSRDGYVGTANAADRNIAVVADSGDVLINPTLGATSLRHAAVEKLRTRSDGITITGRTDSTTFKRTSDRTLKKNLRKLNTDNILELEAWMFDFKDESLGLNQISYMAQDAQKYLPSSVEKGGNGKLLLDTTAILIAKVAELEKQLKKLQDVS